LRKKRGCQIGGAPAPGRECCDEPSSGGGSNFQRRGEKETQDKSPAGNSVEFEDEGKKEKKRNVKKKRGGIRKREAPGQRRGKGAEVKLILTLRVLKRKEKY